MCPLTPLHPPLCLRDGRTVQCGVDREGNWIAVEPGETIRLARWTGGVGGMELVASPDEQHVALFIFSGQSSHGYDLFALEPTLTRISGLAETHGHGNPPAFSPDGRWLAALIDVERRVRSGPVPQTEGGAYFEELQDEYSDLRVVVDWARLHVQCVPDPGIDSVTIGVELPLSTDIDKVLEWNTYDAMRFVADDVVELRLPWGAPLEVALPPRDPIVAVLPPVGVRS